VLTQAAAPASVAPAAQVRREPSRKSVKRPFLTLACWGFLACVAGAWLLMREYGDRNWIATVLLISPRWPFALPLVLLWPWATLRKKWVCVGATAAATWVVLFPILGLRLNIPGGPMRGDLRILSCNIHRQQLDAPKMEAVLADVQPDVVALQGGSDMHAESLFGGGGWNVKRVGELFVASKFPIGEVTPFDVFEDAEVSHGEQGAAACFEIQSPKGTVNLINLHLASPHAGFNSLLTDGSERLSGNLERRWRESDQLRELSDRVQGQLVMTGDFNTTDDSPIFREHWKENLADAFSERGFGFGMTYVNNHTQIRIDHTLARPGLKFTRCCLGPAVGSPHRPLISDLICR